MKYIVVNKYGQPFHLVKGDSQIFQKGERALYPRGGVLWLGKPATLFQKRRQANAAITSTLKYSDRKGYDWENAMGYKIVPVED